MKKNVPVQAYLPPHLAAWLDAETRMAKVSRSHWIASVLTDLFQGQEVREEARSHMRQVLDELALIRCTLGALIAAHPVQNLREQVADADQGQIEFEHREVGN